MSLTDVLKALGMVLLSFFFGDLKGQYKEAAKREKTDKEALVNGNQAVSASANWDDNRVMQYLRKRGRVRDTTDNS